ncbi:MAG: hypothetical protein ACO3TI_06980, partial [Aquiluna sp.]
MMAPVYAPNVSSQYASITPSTTEVNLPSVKQPGTGEMIGSIAQSVATKYIGKAAVSAVKGYLASAGTAAASTGAYATGGALGFSALPSVASAGTAAAGTAAAGSAAGTAAGAAAGTAGTLGSAATGASTALGTIAAYAGPVALGYLGGTLMSKVTGGNPVGSGIGGATGVAIGLALGLGPVGLILAGIAGSAIGGMFGNKKPSGKAAGGGFNPFTGRVYGFESKGQDNVGAWNEQTGRIVSSVDRMQTILKLEDKIFEDTQFMQGKLGFNRLSYEVSSRDTTQFHLDPTQGVAGGKRQTLGAYGVGDFDTLQFKSVKGIADRLAQSGLVTDQKYIDRISQSKATKVADFLDDIEFGLNREDMPKAQGPSVGAITDDQSFEEFYREWSKNR